MRSFFALLVSFGFAVVQAAPQLTAQLYQIKGGSDVNNVKLYWGFVDPGTFTVQKGTSPASLTTLATTTGDAWDDYDLRVGTTYYYRITGSAGQSNEVSVTPFTPRGTYRTYDNIQPSSQDIKPDIQVKGTYYRYDYISSSGIFAITESTSTDGYTYTGNTTVLTSDTVCAPIKEPCHLERAQFLFNPRTGEAVMWAHLESNRNYGLAQAACASGIPGSHKWTFHGSSRPLGHDSRDSAFFADDDAQNTAYFISSTNVNQDMNIYKLTPAWTAIDSLTATVLQRQQREAPSMVKVAGTYYLFTSQAAGWYPSTAEYISSTNIATGWQTVPLLIPNTNTWAAQSGGVVKIGASGHIMMADRWGANWDTKAPPNRQIALPTSFGPQGTKWSAYHFYPSVRYSNDGSTGTTTNTNNNGNNVFGVQAGKILSRNKKVTSTPTGGTGLPLAVDGTEDVGNKYFVPASVPFTLQVDLGAEHTITGADVTTYRATGSETFYQFTVTGRGEEAGAKEALLSDQRSNMVVCFVSCPVSDRGQYRYVTLRVDKVINSRNGNEADTFRGVIEFSVMGV